MVLRDNLFAYVNGSYDAEKLLVIGFLYCTFPDNEQQQQDLWALVNPKVEHTVSKQRVRDLLLDFLYIAIDNRIRKSYNKPYVFGRC